MKRIQPIKSRHLLGDNRLDITTINELLTNNQNSIKTQLGQTQLSLYFRTITHSNTIKHFQYLNKEILKN